MNYYLSTLLAIFKKMSLSLQRPERLIQSLRHMLLSQTTGGTEVLHLTLFYFYFTLTRLALTSCGAEGRQASSV